MPYTPAGITVDPNGQTVVVKLTTPSGSAAVAYTTQHGSTLHSFPVTITGRTGFFVADSAIYTLSVTVGGVENANGAGGTRSVDLSGRGVLGVQIPLADPNDAANYLTQTAAKGTYVARAKSGQDSAKAVRDAAYRAWDAQLGDGATTPYLFIKGHSVVAGTGASDQPHTFARLLKQRVEARRYGAVVVSEGNGGYTSAQLLASLPGTFASQPAGSVGCVVLMGMLNDYSGGVDPATTQANLTSIITTLRAHASAAPNMTVVIASEWKRTTASGGYAWSLYTAAAQAVADADPYTTVVDLGARMGDAATDTLSLYSDGTHPSDRGYGLIATLLGDELLPAGALQSLPDHTMISALLPPITKTGTWAVNAVASTTAFGNILIASDGTQDNDITFGFMGDAGVYSIALSMQKRLDGGQFDVYIDGVLQGSGASFDSYNATTTYPAPTTVAGFSVTRAGRHTLRLKMHSKNASATGYVGSIFGIGITRTGPLTV